MEDMDAQMEQLQEMYSIAVTGRSPSVHPAGREAEQAYMEGSHIVSPYAGGDSGTKPQHFELSPREEAPSLWPTVDRDAENPRAQRFQTRVETLSRGPTTTNRTLKISGTSPPKIRRPIR